MHIVSILIGLIFLVAPLQVFAGSVYCECSRYLREIIGVNIPRGDAGTYLPNASMWNINYGDVLILKYPKVWHVAVVVGFEWKKGQQWPENIIVHDSNYIPCTPTTRAISWYDEAIRGIYSPQPMIDSSF